jgi:hypothetical protein
LKITGEFKRNRKTYSGWNLSFQLIKKGILGGKDEIIS